MKTTSPLRYPGGKSAMSGLLRRIRTLNDLETYPIAEPFAGGAGASLTLLLSSQTPRIFINDVDRAVYDFWRSLLGRTTPFMAMLSRKRVSMAEWQRQRESYRKKTQSGLRRGFAAFYLNRCNRSGVIMNGGPIGGIAQKGQWKLDARFNKSELKRRCLRVAEHRMNIEVSAEDGIKFIRSKKRDSVFLFIDPPYFHKGKTLYLNSLDESYHSALASELRSMRNESWVLTYDDCAEIRELYRGWARIRPFSLKYVASKRRSGKELLITPRWMQLPRKQDSESIIW
jgi:DNA adenine methylase